MYDIVTFGSATRDNFLFLKGWKTLRIKNKGFIEGKAYCFPVGKKIEVKEFFFATGGGGTNTAVTFANQGFKTAYCGKIGNDLGGRLILEELQSYNVDTSLVCFSHSTRTDYSFIIEAPGEDRTILTHHGSSSLCSLEDIRFEKALQAKLWYLAPLTGKLALNADKLTKKAKEKNIKIAFNPSIFQLEKKNLLKKILRLVDILILNEKESFLLTGVEPKEKKKFFAKLKGLTEALVLVTRGEKGAFLFDGNILYEVEAFKIKVVDSTGAGDAFGSGFVAGYLSTNDIVYSLQLATANAASCIKKIGAKTGLLKKGDKWQKARVFKKIL